VMGGASLVRVLSFGNSEMPTKPAIVENFVNIGYTFFILLFLYFWWQMYESPNLTVDDLNGFTNGILLEVFVYSLLVWGFIFFLLAVHSGLTSTEVKHHLNRERYLPSYLFYIFKFFIYCIFTAYICKVVTNAYLGFFVDMDRARSDMGFQYVVTRCVMFANLVLFFFIFQMIKPEVRDI